MPRFKSLSGDDLDVFAPAGDYDSFPVAAGAEIEVPGDLAAETADSYVVGVGDEARSWSKALWALVVPATPAAAKAASEEK